MEKFKTFIDGFLEFFASESFERDPYGYLTNQIGHMFLGCYVMTMVIGFYFYFIVGGTEWPDQTPFVVGVVLSYVLVWELGIQGWRGLDTVEDGLYFFFGAGLWLFIEMDIVIDRLITWCFVFTVLLGFGVIRRIKEKERL